MLVEKNEIDTHDHVPVQVSQLMTIQTVDKGWCPLRLWVQESQADSRSGGKTSKFWYSRLSPFPFSSWSVIKIIFLSSVQFTLSLPLLVCFPFHCCMDSPIILRDRYFPDGQEWYIFFIRRSATCWFSPLSVQQTQRWRVTRFWLVLPKGEMVKHGDGKTCLPLRIFV